MSYTATVVLVHGAWADASSWRNVIKLLFDAGVAVRAVQIPLTALADDVAAVRRTLADIAGPVVLVGHSWGGTVITEAGADDKVKGLVYLAAFANDAGQSGNDLLAPYGAPGVLSAIRPDGQGFLLVTETGMAEIIAHDLPAAETRLLAAVQRPLAETTFTEAVTRPAWASRPSWYVIAGDDRAISPQMQRDFAARMGATTSELASSHMLIASQPEAVAAAISEAVASVTAAVADQRPMAG